MADEATTQEWRIGWSASSNASFQGFSEWEAWEDDGDPEEVLSSPEGSGPINLPPGLEMMLEFAGIDWWVETRDASGGAS